MQTHLPTQYKMNLTENQWKVIRDKYLRDTKTAEEWLYNVARNIALAEILYLPGAKERGVLNGVSCKEVSFDTKQGEKSALLLFHEGILDTRERDRNFFQFLKNLYDAAEKEDEAKRLVAHWEEKFFMMLATFDFLPNSPTLMNAGRELQQLSACYVLPVDDSMEGITNALKAQALIHKSGGGTGFSFGRLRPGGDEVKSTKGVASGAISFMQIFDKMTDVVKQGGTRRGANMGILPYYHPEILDFITMKEKAGVMENFNVSVAIDKKFMKAVEEETDIELLNPRTKEITGTINARELFDKIVESAWRTGDPGFIMIDRINESFSNPTPALGMIESTNPCFSGHVRLATDHGLLTFEELYIDKTEISVATDNRAHSIRASESGGGTAVAVRASTGVTLRKAVPVFKTRRNCPVFKLETEHGFEVTATADHKFFTPDGLKELKDINPGDEVLIQSGAGAWSSDDTLPPFIADNKLGARIGRGEAKLPERWSRELGELLGWIVGDGWVSAETPKGRNVPNYTVGLIYGDEEKKTLAPKFRRLIHEWTGLKGAQITRRGTLTQYYKSSLFYFLRCLGLTAAEGTEKTVPASLWHAPREAVLGFLSALFTADGTVNVSPNIHYSSIRLANSSKRLLQEAQQLLLNEGILSHLYLRRKAGEKMMPDSLRQPKLYSFSDQYELVITRGSRARFLKEIGFLTASKQLKGVGFENALSRGAYMETFTTKVKAVTPAGYADVYCTTEPETHSINCGGIVSANCGEQPLLPNEPCNLGSINLANFVKNGTSEPDFDYEKLSETTKLATRFLDNVIDVNNYPVPEIERMAKGNRRIGLGVMGWAEALVKLGIPYDSDEALEKARGIMKFINEKSLEASCELAKERGLFPYFKDSIFDNRGNSFRVESYPRNCARTTIAPTGTIAIAAGLQGGGIEPFFGITYTRYNAKALAALRDGKQPDEKDVFYEVNPYFEDVAAKHDFFGLTKEALWKKIDDNHKSVRGIPEIPEKIQKMFASSHDIPYDIHVKVQAAFQAHTDNAVSKTINLPHDATIEDVRNAYLLAYELGCKGITIYRDGSKSQQVLNLTGHKKEEKAAKKERDLSSGTLSEYFEIQTGYGPLHIHIDYDEDGPYRFFTNIPPVGTEISGLTSIMGILLSKYLEAGGDPMRIIKHLNSVKGDRPHGLGVNRTNSIPHAIAKALRMHLMKTGKMVDTQGLEQAEKDFDVSKLTAYCPTCFSSNVSFESGCTGPTCHDCGYSECS